MFTHIGNCAGNCLAYLCSPRTLLAVLVAITLLAPLEMAARADDGPIDPSPDFPLELAPDLKVTGWSYDQTRQDTLWVRVVNQGGSESNRCRLLMKVTTPSHLLQRVVMVPRIAAGETAWVRWQASSMDLTPISTLWAVVDITDLVPESNESNNTYFTFTVSSIFD
jgi:hypothetical protein